MEEHREIKKYFQECVNPEFEALITNIVKLRPEDIVEYAISWFKDEKKNKESDSSDQEEGKHQDIDATVFVKMRRERLENSTRRQRYGVSSGCKPSQQRKAIGLLKAPEKLPKSEMKILFFFMNSFLFQNFSEAEKRRIMESMNPHGTEQDEVLIKEGDEGDCMYFVEEGLFECSLMIDSQKKFLRNYQSGDTFGQLALLHNSKRSATVKSITEGMVYSLSRQTYRQMQKMCIVKKREDYLEIITKIAFFQNIERDELEKVCDLLKELTCEPGKYVIIEGDIGDRFYIVLEGILVAKRGHEETISQFFKDGDSFGELALLSNEPRKASVIAVTKASLVYMTRDIFKRIVNKEKIENDILNRYGKMRTIPRKKRER